VNIKHGTYAGWNAHRKTGVPMCDPCRAAKATYQRNYRATTPGARAADNYWTRTRKLALEQLAREYPGRFVEILHEIRETVQAG
jgi:hypothetical protein